MIVSFVFIRMKQKECLPMHSSILGTMAIGSPQQPIIVMSHSLGSNLSLKSMYVSLSFQSILSIHTYIHLEFKSRLAHIHTIHLLYIHTIHLLYIHSFIYYTFTHLLYIHTCVHIYKLTHVE